MQPLLKKKKLKSWGWWGVVIYLQGYIETSSALFVVIGAVRMGVPKCSFYLSIWEVSMRTQSSVWIVLQTQKWLQGFVKGDSVGVDCS